MTVCSIGDCTNRSYCRTWCKKHYMRWTRHDDPLKTTRFTEGYSLAGLKERTRETESGCWIWQGVEHTAGYARLGMIYVHRLTYELAKGAIPDGLYIDHLCRTRLCINPEHLEAVTNRENILRGESVSAVNALKTHCAKGHPYSGDNLKYRANGSRYCRECNRLNALAVAARKRGAA